MCLLFIHWSISDFLQAIITREQESRDTYSSGGFTVQSVHITTEVRQVKFTEGNNNLLFTFGKLDWMWISLRFDVKNDNDVLVYPLLSKAGYMYIMIGNSSVISSVYSWFFHAIVILFVYSSFSPTLSYPVLLNP